MWTSKSKAEIKPQVQHDANPPRWNGVPRGTMDEVSSPKLVQMGSPNARSSYGECSELPAGRFETRTAPMVTFGAGDTGAVVDLTSG